MQHYICFFKSLQVVTIPNTFTYYIKYLQSNFRIPARFTHTNTHNFLTNSEPLWNILFMHVQQVARNRSYIYKTSNKYLFSE